MKTDGDREGIENYIDANGTIRRELRTPESVFDPSSLVPGPMSAARDVAPSSSSSSSASTRDVRSMSPEELRGQGRGLRMKTIGGRYDRHVIDADHVTITDRTKKAPNDRNPVRTTGRARKKRRGF